ncbi:MAG: branched-chain amino acid ABC transporter permease [Deltaproteobacteria bacterium]|nr:branched-chain amino acid ABC transporter permease [Deltaproteobacteria bacterium]
MESILIQAIVSGILLGLIYGLIGMGMNIIYGVMRVVNFAHGEFMMLAAYICYWLNRQYATNPLHSLIIIVPLFFGLGFLVYYLFVPRLLNSEDPEMASFLVFFGISLVLSSLILIIWGADPRGIPFPFKRVSVSIGEFFFPLGRLIAGGFCGIVILLLILLLFKTYLGKAIRAIIQNREAVSILGIDTHLLSAFSFGIGLLLVGLAGGLVILSFPAITPMMGSSYTLVAFVVVILGGLGTPLGALLGGFIFGLAENIGAVFMPTSLSPVIAFVLLITMILIRPQGILGEG